jgi:hypothetical protein
LRIEAGQGPVSHQVIELAATGQLGMAATGQLGMAAAGQIRLAVVMRDEGSSHRWFGLTSRQFRKVITRGHDGGPGLDQA